MPANLPITSELQNPGRFELQDSKPTLGLCLERLGVEEAKITTLMYKLATDGLLDPNAPLASAQARQAFTRILQKCWDDGHMEETFSGSRLSDLDPEIGGYLVYCICHQYRVGNKKRLVKVWNSRGSGDQPGNPGNEQLPARRSGPQRIQEEGMPEGMRRYVEDRMAELSLEYQQQSDQRFAAVNEEQKKLQEGLSKVDEAHGRLEQHVLAIEEDQQQHLLEIKQQIAEINQKHEMDLAALKEHVDQLETAQECSIGALTHMQVRQSLAARKLPPNTSIMLRLAPNQIPGSSATSLPAAGTLTRLSLSEPAASYCMCSREFTFDAVFPGHLTPAAVALELLGQRDIDPFTDTSDPSTTRLYLLGPSGSGKTTLLREICTRALLSPKALIETAIEIDPMGNTKARQDLKTKALQSHNEIAQLTEILNCRKSAETPENRSSSRTALAITISVDSDEGSSKLVIVDLPGWEVAETRVNQGTGVSSGIINQEHGVIEEVLYKWAQGIKWVGRPSGKIACWLKEELQTVDEDDKVVFIMFARGGEKRRWRGLVNFLGKMKTE